MSPRGNAGERLGELPGGWGAGPSVRAAGDHPASSPVRKLARLGSRERPAVSPLLSSSLCCLMLLGLSLLSPSLCWSSGSSSASLRDRPSDAKPATPSHTPPHTTINCTRPPSSLPLVPPLRRSPNCAGSRFSGCGLVT